MFNLNFIYSFKDIQNFYQSYKILFKLVCIILYYFLLMVNLNAFYHDKKLKVFMKFILVFNYYFLDQSDTLKILQFNYLLQVYKKLKN